MSLIQISYDLRNHATMNQYEELIKELERLGAKKVQLSEWMWQSTNTPVQIRDHLRRFIHDTDRLLITAVNDWASWNSLTRINDI